MSKKRTKNSRKKELREKRAKSLLKKNKQNSKKVENLLHHKLPYKITWEPIKEKINKIPEKLNDRLQIIHDDLVDNPKKYLDELIELDKIHPEIESISNYLSAIYFHLEDKDKHEKILKENIKRFPNYFFAHVHLAELYLNDRKYDDFEQLMTIKLSLKDFYPDRDVFHISEVESSLYLLVRYFALQVDQKNTLLYFDILTEISPESPYLFKLFPFIAEYRLSDFFD